MSYLFFKVRKTQCRKKNLAMRGFTLIEMLVVIVIISIVLAIAAPSLIDFTRRQSLSSAGSVLQSACMEARGLSIKSRQNVRVEVYLSDYGGDSSRDVSARAKGDVLVYIDQNNDGVMNADPASNDERTIEVRKLPEHIEIESTTPNIPPPPSTQPHVVVYIFQAVGTVENNPTTQIVFGQEGSLLTGRFTVERNTGKSTIRITEPGES